MTENNISIANKFRPQRFEDVRGQKSTVESIKGKLREDKVPRTSLFCGKHGCGKTTIARILAKAVNCENPDTDGNPCCKCQSCISIDAGVSPDVLELDAASHNKVEDAENILKQASYLPNGKKRVVILDEAHMFSKAAQNKILKALEEPPAHVIYILCTTEEGGLLDTILSRCNKFTFGSIPDKDILENLIMVCQKEGIEYEEDALKMIVKKANGHVRDSLSLLEQLSYDKLMADRVREELGIPTDDQIFELLQLVLLKDMQSVLCKVEEVIKQGNISEFLKLLVETLCYICTFDENVVDTQTSSYRGYCSMIKENATTATLLNFVNVITRCLRDNRGLGLELATRLCFLTMISEAEKEDKVLALEQQISILTKEICELKTRGISVVNTSVSTTEMPAIPPSIPDVEKTEQTLPDSPMEDRVNDSDDGWEPVSDMDFEINEMEAPTSELLEEVPFSMPSSSPVTAQVSDVPFDIPGGTIVNTQPVSTPSDDSVALNIPGGTIVNKTTESEVHKDEPVMAAPTMSTDFGNGGFFGGGFGSIDSRQW